MELSRKDVEKVALLGRLQLSAEELTVMTDQLRRIIGYVEQLSELNTDGVEPLAHAVELHDVFRDDLPGEHLSRAAALANAPKRDDECYRVPAVLGE